jgi:prophage maintenance system killer protein
MRERLPADTLQERPAAPPQPAPTLALASAIGNQAFARHVAARRTVAREPAATDSLVLQSQDPSLDGRDAQEVSGELRDMLTSYRDGVETFTGSALKLVAAEQQWARNLNLFGELVELFNGVELPDPGRWDAVFALWDEVQNELDGAIGQTAPESLAGAGAAGQAALELFDQAFALGQQTSDEFLAYVQGFQGAAQTVHTVASVTRDIAFCALLASVAVVAAPAAVGMGLTAGETALAMGLTGGVVGGGVNANAAAIVEAMDLMHDLVVEGQSSDQALDGVDWALIGQEGIDGFQRGFIDGVLAYVGVGLDKALAGGEALAATQLQRLGSGLLARLLQTAMVRAGAGGASGAITGALDAGAKAAVDGASFEQVVQAMRDGFLLGGAAGAVLGGAGGAVSEAFAARLRSEMDALGGLLVKDPEEFARRYQALVESMTPEQRAAWDVELQGRRFVDKAFYDKVAAEFEAGNIPVRPEHTFDTPDQDVFEDWQQAASVLDENAKAGQPLTQEQVQLAHEAAMDWKLEADPGEIRDRDIVGRGGLGANGDWSALTPEQATVLRRNPVINLLDVGQADAELTLRQQADGYITAQITYPPEQFVQQHLDEFFAWYADALNTMDPTELAATAQRRLVSIHPFVDGNGRVSRLVMDDALQRAGLPPALLADPNLDIVSTKAAWIEEVRAGVVEAYLTTARHADVFNQALRTPDLVVMAAEWGAILELTSDPEPLVAWLYPQ